MVSDVIINTFIVISDENSIDWYQTRRIRHFLVVQGLGVEFLCEDDVILCEEHFFQKISTFFLVFRRS